MMNSTAATLPFYWYLDNSGADTPVYNPFSLMLSGGKCVCCKQETQTQLNGYWVHPECAYKVAEYTRLAETEIPAIRIQILFSRRCLEASILSLGYDDKKLQAIRKAVEKKAWKIFKQRHPVPWLSVNSSGKQSHR